MKKITKSKNRILVLIDFILQEDRNISNLENEFFYLFHLL